MTAMVLSARRGIGRLGIGLDSQRFRPSQKPQWIFLMLVLMLLVLWMLWMLADALDSGC